MDFLKQVGMWAWFRRRTQGKSAAYFVAHGAFILFCSASGVALALWAPQALFFVYLAVIAFWALRLALSHFTLSRRAAFFLSYALLGLAATVVYYDRPAATLVDSESQMRFGLGAVDPNNFQEVRYRSPDIRLEQDVDGWWWGQVRFIGEWKAVEDSASKTGSLGLIAWLPTWADWLPDSVEPLGDPGGTTVNCTEDQGAGALEVVCTMDVAADTREFGFLANFWLRPSFARMRLGEHYMRPLRFQPEPAAALPAASPDHLPPRISFFVTPSESAITAVHPEPDYALEDGYGWRLDLPSHVQQYVDLTIVDRRSRFLADQAPQVLALGGGILLGLLVEPLHAVQQQANPGSASAPSSSQRRLPTSGPPQRSGARRGAGVRPSASRGRRRVAGRRGFPRA